jgi:hypothetical protein
MMRPDPPKPNTKRIMLYRLTGFIFLVAACFNLAAAYTNESIGFAAAGVFFTAGSALYFFTAGRLARRAKRDSE